MPVENGGIGNNSKGFQIKKLELRNLGNNTNNQLESFLNAEEGLEKLMRPKNFQD